MYYYYCKSAVCFNLIYQIILVPLKEWSKMCSLLILYRVSQESLPIINRCKGSWNTNQAREYNGQAGPLLIYSTVNMYLNSGELRYIANNSTREKLLRRRTRRKRRKSWIDNLKNWYKSWTSEVYRSAKSRSEIATIIANLYRGDGTWRRKNRWVGTTCILNIYLETQCCKS